MRAFGYNIHKALVVDVEPAAVVKNSMNDINANKRKRVAASETAEAQKIVSIKRAEARDGENTQRTGFSENCQQLVKMTILRDSGGSKNI